MPFGFGSQPPQLTADERAQLQRLLNLQPVQPERTQNMTTKLVAGTSYKIKIPFETLMRSSRLSGLKLFYQEYSQCFETVTEKNINYVVLKDDCFISVQSFGWNPYGGYFDFTSALIKSGSVLKMYNWENPTVTNWEDWFLSEEDWKATLPQPKKTSIHSVIIATDKIEQIQAAISQPQYNDLIFTEWGFSEVFEKGTAVSLLFYGSPGTGKTLMAQAIADELQQELKILGTADIESMEPGGAERAMKKYFEEANRRYDLSLKKQGKAQILLFDECDSLLSDRDQIGVILAAQVNTLLTELERFKGVVIFTTNRLGKLDPALERRITSKIFFETPNKEQRFLIWKRMIPSKAPIGSDVDFEELSAFPLPGGNIKNAVLNAVRKAAYSKSKTIDRKHFMDSVDQELSGLTEFAEHHKKATKQAAPIGGLSATKNMGLTIQKGSKTGTAN